jgi:hypothetical protein
VSKGSFYMLQVATNKYRGYVRCFWSGKVCKKQGCVWARTLGSLHSMYMLSLVTGVSHVADGKLTL